MKHVIKDNIFNEYKTDYKMSMANIESTDVVASRFDSLLSQACQRTFDFRETRHKNYHNKAKWYDKECSQLRSTGVKAGERVYDNQDKLLFNQACKNYKACKQRKKRQFRSSCVNEIESIMKANPSDLFSYIDKINPINHDINTPSGEEFYHHFDKLAKPEESPDFDYEYEKNAKSILENYDTEVNIMSKSQDSNHELLNDCFTNEEISVAIDSLKNNKSPGADFIPPEFIKICKSELKEDITNLFNYILEKREFPERWAEGIKSAIFKRGNRLLTENYRGVTVPKIFEKLFEIVVYNRLQFFNEAFNKIDESNGGFLKGRRTSDNIFILNGLIQKQLLLGKRLYVCFVDFSSAFDKINRYILFQKLIEHGWSGRIIDTLRDLYKKTHFRIKKGGKISPIIENIMGVNQGGNASGFLFRKYMADLSDYLKSEFGVTIGSKVLAHILWADDLILMSDTLCGLCKQLDGLKYFCVKNQMSVNALKTKIMVFGPNQKVNVHFDDAAIEQVSEYRYVGCIIQAISNPYSDPFKLNYTYLCDQANKALFSIKQKLKPIGFLPPKAFLHLINASIKPILTYGSDVWGINRLGRDTVDRMFLQILKYMLGVKQSTSSLMVYGETGEFSPSLSCIYNNTCFLNRISHMDSKSLVRLVYDELGELHRCGFKNWYGKAWDLMTFYNLSMNLDQNRFKKLVKHTLRSRFVQNWSEGIFDHDKNPSLRTYSMFKNNFGMEIYLDRVSNFKYRRAITRLRVSSHHLMIERGRHHTIKLDIAKRLCSNCGKIEDEIHFLVDCPLYSTERIKLYKKIDMDYEIANNENSKTVFCRLMNLKYKDHLEKIGEFIFSSFKKNRELGNS